MCRRLPSDSLKDGLCCPEGRQVSSKSPEIRGEPEAHQETPEVKSIAEVPLSLVKFLSRFAKAVFMVAKSVVRLQSSKYLLIALYGTCCPSSSKYTIILQNLVSCMEYLVMVEEAFSRKNFRVAHNCSFLI